MTQRLQGKHALLTGAAGGIGLAVATAFLQAGARCTVADMGAQPTPELAALMANHPDTLHYIPTDVTQSAQIDALLAAASARFGSITSLFNNAAIFDMAPLLESNEAMYDKIFAVNVKGAFFVMQKVLAHMVAQGVQGGAVVNMASQAGRRGEALVSHYCASKAAVFAYCESLRGELKPLGIQVVTLAPGYIQTPLTAKNKFPMPFLMTAEAFAHQAFKTISRGTSFRVIPFPMAWVARVLRILPDALFDRAFKNQPRKHRAHE